jgi:Zn-dependent M28 family amino/carboxypeptidase
VPAPGANDDAVGCAALLALARAAKGRRPTPTVEIDFFGSEEYRDATPGAHHFGSRARVASLSRKQLRRISGMITLDVIAVGSQLHTRTMGRGPLTMSNLLIRTARWQGVSMTYLRDPGTTGWSDHEMYEKAGVPVAWVERLTDPAYHTASDTSARLTAAPIAQTMRIVLGALNSLDVARLNRLR